MLKNLSLKSLHAAAMRVMGMLLSYSFLFLITQYSGDETVGRFIFALSVHALVSTLCLFGTDNSVMILYNDSSISKNTLRLKTNLVFGVFTWSALIIIILLSLMINIYQPVQQLYNVAYILISLPFFTTFIAQITLFRAQERILAFAALRNIPFFLLSSIIFIVLVNIISDIELSIYIAIILSSIICFSLIWFLQRDIAFYLIDKAVIFRIFSVSIPFILSSGAIIINSNLDILILGLLSNDTIVAIYGINQKVTILASFGLLVISVPVAPMFARLIASGEHSAFVYVWRISAGLSVIFAIIYLGSVYTIYGEIFNFLNWASYSNISLFLILGAAQIANCAAGPVFHALNMSGGSKLVAIIQAITILINVPGNLILYQFFDFYGVALSTLISTMLLQAMGLAAYKYLNATK